MIPSTFKGFISDKKLLAFYNSWLESTAFLSFCDAVITALILNGKHAS